MPRLLQYVSGVRLIVDPYDHRLWHFTVQGKRYDLRARGGSYVLRTETGEPLGTFNDLNRAVERSREHVHAAATERIPILSGLGAGARLSGTDMKTATRP